MFENEQFGIYLIFFGLICALGTDSGAQLGGPGKIFPKSFTWKFLFNTEALKSPIIPINEKTSDTDTKVVSGMNGLIECAVYSGADTVLNSVVGMIGLQPTHLLLH